MFLMSRMVRICKDGGAVLEGSTAGVEERTEETDTYNTTCFVEREKLSMEAIAEESGGGVGEEGICGGLPEVVVVCR
ncbi:hypothetical protein Tco_0848910, partial [Tanacetum coccineum]